MSYMEIMKRALKNRSINAVAKVWGMKQTTLNNYATGKRVPDPITTDIIMKEAGVSAEEMHRALVDLERQHRAKLAKIAEGFNHLLRAANLVFSRNYTKA